WIFLAVAFSEGLSSFALPYAEYALLYEPDSSLPGADAMTLLGALAWFPGFVLLFTYAPLLFPDGRLPSRRWRPVAWISAVPLAIFALFAAWLWPYRGQTFLEDPNRFRPGALLGTIFDAMVPLALLCGLVCIVSVAVRFWRSRGAQRQQIKWFAYAIAVTLGVQILSDYLLDDPIASLLMLLVAPSVPVAVGIAVLRYRLYDIDLLINRTLVYGALMAILALVYFGGVATLQAILQTFTGQEQLPQLAIVVSTLLIAALFSPLRRRIQGLIDRRFYRRKYDAAKTLEAFNARLRDETDLNALSGDVVGVVRDTVQPAHVRLWLRSPTEAGRGGGPSG
ncbi:MAG TPA: hypothetical protein VGW38_25885, partial [Chloroflexota bacterium]|nr:hypothetical protein [Chloroflexota bacterium]